MVHHRSDLGFMKFGGFVEEQDLEFAKIIERIKRDKFWVSHPCESLPTLVNCSRRDLIANHVP